MAAFSFSQGYRSMTCFLITAVYLAQVDAVQVTSQMTSTGVTGSNATLVCSWVPDTDEILFTLDIKSQSGRNYYTYFIGRDNQPQSQDNPQRDRLSVDSTTQDSTSVTMRITGLVCDDEQIYQCQVNYNYLTGPVPDNQVEMKNASLTIRVPPAQPVMDSTSPSNLTGGVAEYSVVTFTCSGNIGKPGPGSVIWKLFRASVEEQLLPSDHRVTTTDVSLLPGEAPCSQRKRSVLTMNVSRSDQDLVVACFIRNNDFSPSGSPTTCEDNTSDLCVQTETIRIHYGVRSAYASRDPQSDLYEGSQVTLTCSAEGFPVPTYTWFKVGEEDNILSSSTNGQFTISSLNDRQHSGEYICKASNTVFGTTYIKSDRVYIAVLVSQQPIVSVDEIEDDGTFSINCDASRMTNLASSVNNIVSLGIKLQTSQTLPNAATNGLLALYKSYGSVTQIQNIPPGRHWTVSFTGVNGGANNRNTTKLVVLVSDAKCIDAGLYTCEVHYEDSTGATQLASSTQNVTAKAAVQDITLDADKYFAVPGRPNYSEYQEGDNITLTCRIDGPQELEMMWKTGTYDTFNGFTTWDYPYDNDITTSDPTLISSGACNTYGHMSVLNLRSLSQDVNDQVTYLCVIMENDQFGAPEVARANITIGITSRITTSTPGPATAGGNGTGSFTITVDADSVTIPEDGITDIVALTLNRRTTQDQDFQFVAKYKVYGSQPEVTNIPAGRDWTVTFSGANCGANNRNTMKMEVVIRDAQSSDAGLYQFIVRYTRPQDGADVDVDVTQVLIPATNGGCQP